MPVYVQPAVNCQPSFCWDNSLSMKCTYNIPLNGSSYVYIENCIILQATVTNEVAFQYGGNEVVPAYRLYKDTQRKGNPTIYFKHPNKVCASFHPGHHWGKDFVIECDCKGLLFFHGFATVILYANAQGVNMYCEANNSGNWNSVFVPKDDFPALTMPFDYIFKSREIIFTSDV